MHKLYSERNEAKVVEIEQKQRLMEEVKCKAFQSFQQIFASPKHSRICSVSIIPTSNLVGFGCQSRFDLVCLSDIWAVGGFIFKGEISYGASYFLRNQGRAHMEDASLFLDAGGTSGRCLTTHHG
ncbi:hypothetical protein K1719_009455 [Acacia pycnantha]|nr:hypothetical protein K1719_009455 [Acacia pycnantha]